VESAFERSTCDDCIVLGQARKEPIKKGTTFLEILTQCKNGLKLGECESEILDYI
jgi:hypothetical protein